MRQFGQKEVSTQKTPFIEGLCATGIGSLRTRN
jgi:hypothetical protein